MTTVAGGAKPAMKPRNQWLLGIAVVIGMVGGIGLVGKLTSGGGGKPAAAAQAAPPTIKSADPAITSVSIQAPLVTIQADLKDAPDEAAYITLAGTTAESVGRAIQKGVSDNLTGVQTVDLAFRASMGDRLGDEGMAPFMVVSLSAADLRAANYDNLQWAGALSLATSVKLEGHSGRQAVTAWCLKNGWVAPAFCVKATGESANSRPHQPPIRASS